MRGELRPAVGRGERKAAGDRGTAELVRWRDGRDDPGGDVRVGCPRETRARASARAGAHVQGVEKGQFRRWSLWILHYAEAMHASVSERLRR
jgi:hypothetical protein